MSPRGVLNAVGALLLFLAVGLLVPLGVALGYGSGDARAFGVTLAVTAAAGLAMFVPTRGAVLGTREGFGVVVFGWTAIALCGSLPFVLSGAIPDFTDAFFETMSGFTTTGASVLADIDGLPRGVAFWRCFIQWLGGMGIIVLSLAILPMLGVGGMQLYQAEAPGPSAEKLTPRIRQTAVLLWSVYLVLSVAECVLLKLAGMGWYDAVCHTFTTMATGGFSTRGASIAAYDSAAIDWIIVVFMFLAGVNFALHWRVRGRPWRYFADPEWRVYAGIVAGLAAVVTFALWHGAGRGIGEAFRVGTFQVVSIVTTTGYATDDYEAWHPALRWLVVLMMFVGGCGGSTAGSVKIVRVIILAKTALRELRTVANPRVVRALQLGPGRKLERGIGRKVLGFFVLYVVLLVAGTLLLTTYGMGIETALSAAATSLGNVGPGLADVGPMDNFGWMPVPAKWILIFLMLLGRLEIYTVLALFLPETWKR
jgi:trk system potassium uptake protein TrkH